MGFLHGRRLNTKCKPSLSSPSVCGLPVGLLARPLLRRHGCGRRAVPIHPLARLCTWLPPIPTAFHTVCVVFQPPYPVGRLHSFLQLWDLRGVYSPWDLTVLG